MSEGLKKDKLTLTIGNGEDHAGVFNEDKHTITLVIILKGGVGTDKKAQNNDMFERIALMTGSNYSKKEKNNEDIYILEVFKIKQLERLAPRIANIYSTYKFDVDVVIDKSCYEFLPE